MRNEQARRAQVRATPDKRKSLSSSAQNFEKAAATFATVAGIFFADSPNVALGVGGEFDENELFVGKNPSNEPLVKDSPPEAPPVFGPRLDE